MVITDIAKRVSSRFILGSVLLAGLLFTLDPAQADSLTAQVDRNSMSIDETLNFRLVYEGQQSNRDPDLSALTQQFDILSNQKSMQHSVVNGSVSASTEWHMVLAPKNTGQLLIPPFTLNGQRSSPLTITVTEASTDPISGKEDVFVETFVDKTNVFVQEQFLVTYRLYFNRSVESLDAQQLAIDNARIEALPRVDYQKTLGHSQYGVAEYKYAVFADASGVIDIPVQTWTVRTTDQPSMSRFGFNGGRYKLHRAKTKALRIEVAPKPGDYPANAVWLPAQEVTIDESWSQTPASVKVGEPVTRTVTLRATGAAVEHLAPIFGDSPSPDFKYYPDKPNQDQRLSDRGVIGTRTEAVAIVPTRSGELTLPAVAVTWWNTDRKRVEVATLPARTLTVIGAAAPAPGAVDTSAAVLNPAAPASASPSSTPWLWIALALVSAVGNLILLSLLWRRRSSITSSSAAHGDQAKQKDLFKKVQQACASQSAEATRMAILAWAKNRWGAQVNSLAKVGKWSSDPQLMAELHALDSALFGGAGAQVDYGQLKSRLEALNQDHAVLGRLDHSQLKPLYAAP